MSAQCSPVPLASGVSILLSLDSLQKRIMLRARLQLDALYEFQFSKYYS